MNKSSRLNNAWKVCPECGIHYRDGHRHMSGYGDSKMRCPRQHIRGSMKNNKKGISNHAGSPYSRGG